MHTGWSVHEPMDSDWMHCEFGMNFIQYESYSISKRSFAIHFRVHGGTRLTQFYISTGLTEFSNKTFCARLSNRSLTNITLTFVAIMFNKKKLFENNWSKYFEVFLKYERWTFRILSQNCLAARLVHFLRQSNDF